MPTLKTTLNTLDIILLVEKLKPFLIGSYVTKIHNTDFGVLIVIKTREEKIEIVINHSGWLFMTKYEIEKKEPDQFIKELRKNLEGKKIINVSVPFFDRYIVIEFEKGFKLIIEMMHGGNIILTNNDVIITALKIKKEKNRNIVKNEKYIRPEIFSFNPLKEDLSSYYDKIINSKANIVATLVRFFGIPAEIAEEACLVSNINKETLGKEISLEQVKLLDKKIKELCTAYLQNNKSYIILSKNNEYISVTKLELNIHKNYDKKIFDEFNEAVEEYFIYLKKKEKEKEKMKEKEKKLFIINDLNKKILEIKNQIEIINSFINLFKDNILEIDNILTNSHKIIEEKKWDRLKDFLYSSWPKNLGSIENIDLKNKKIIINYQNILIELNLFLNSTKNLEILYNIIKENKNKIIKIEEKIKEVEKEVKKEEIKKEVKEKLKKSWYESYLWFYTSNDVLVVSGRDASQNESLIKRKASENDIILHADIHGSPFTVIKANENKPISENDIFEAAQFTASYSSAWKEGFGNIDVYWVNKNQVSKKSPSGTYLSKGSFMIYGNKNYIRNVPLCLAVVVEDNTVKVIPQVTAEKKYKEYILLIPGNFSKEYIIEKIINILIRNKKRINKKLIKEELIKNLPKVFFYGFSSYLN